MDCKRGVRFIDLTSRSPCEVESAGKIDVNLVAKVSPDNVTVRYNNKNISILKRILVNK
jgi:hypothetical protein